MNPNIPRAIALLLIASFIAPHAGALPDPGVWKTADQVESDNPLTKAALPCNQQGIVWSGLGNPLIAQAVRDVGEQACSRLTLEGAITMVQDTSVTGSASDDGDITVRVVFPVVKTPILVPYHNQDTDSPSFLGDAQRDALAPVSNWVPYFLNPNNGVPCTQATTGVPDSASETLVTSSWTFQARPCGDTGASGPDPVSAPSGINVGNAATIVPPKTIASVQRLSLLRVTGIVPLASGAMQPIFQQAFLNVALVNNMATEALTNVQQTVQQAGYTAQQTTFLVEAYLTEAQAAVGDKLGTVTHADVPTLGQGVLLTLPEAPVAPTVANPVAAPHASATASSSGSCNPTPSGNAQWLTVENGCVDFGAVIDQPDTAQQAWIGHNVYSRPYDNSWNPYTMRVETSGSTAFFNIPAAAGILDGGTSVYPFALGPAFQVTNPNVNAVRINAVWNVTGDVVRRCDTGDQGYCIASGADFSSRMNVQAYTATGANAGSAGSDYGQELYAAPLHMCAPTGAPFDFPGWEWMSPFIGCFWDVVASHGDTGDQAFNQYQIVRSVVVNVKQNHGWLAPDSNMLASVSGTDLGNLPQFPGMDARFVGFQVQAA